MAGVRYPAGCEIPTVPTTAGGGLSGRSDGADGRRERAGDSRARRIAHAEGLESAAGAGRVSGVLQARRIGDGPMRFARHGSIVLTTIAAGVIFPCWNQRSETIAARAGAPRGRVHRSRRQGGGEAGVRDEMSGRNWQTKRGPSTACSGIPIKSNRDEVQQRRETSSSQGLQVQTLRPGQDDDVAHEGAADRRVLEREEARSLRERDEDEHISNLKLGISNGRRFRACPRREALRKLRIGHGDTEALRKSLTEEKAKRRRAVP